MKKDGSTREGDLEDSGQTDSTAAEPAKKSPPSSSSASLVRTDSSWLLRRH